MALSTMEKLHLIDELWTSLGANLDQLDVSSEEKKLLDDRWNKFLANPDSALTTEQFEALLAQRRK